MTRKSRREIERELSDVSGRRDRQGDPAIVYKTEDTGEWIDMEGRSVDPDRCPLMVILPTDDQIAEQEPNA